MLDQTLTLPEDPEELRSFTARLLAEVKAQAILIHCPAVDCKAINEREEAPAPIGRTSRAPVRGIVRDRGTASAGA
jgi:phage FluMu protein Com